MGPIFTPNCPRFAPDSNKRCYAPLLCDFCPSHPSRFSLTGLALRIELEEKGVQEGFGGKQGLASHGVVGGSEEGVEVECAYFVKSLSCQNVIIICRPCLKPTQWLE